MLVLHLLVVVCTVSIDGLSSSTWVYLLSFLVPTVINYFLVVSVHWGGATNNWQNKTVSIDLLLFFGTLICSCLFVCLFALLVCLLFWMVNRRWANLEDGGISKLAPIRACKFTREVLKFISALLPPSGGYTQSCAQTKIKFARIPDQKKGATDETQLCV